MQTSKYLLANERDKEWGLTVSTIGYEMIEPGESYPTKGHADGYYFDLKKGRELDEYQLLYQPEGEGVFQSAHIAETPIKAGDIFLLFPGEWHTYHPCPEKGWHSYWIGFKGKNIDDRVKAGFLSPEKPIYHVGFSNDILSLYKEAYRIAQEDLGRYRQPSHRHDVLSGTQHHPEQEHSPCGYDQQGPTAHTRILGERPHHTEDSRRPGGKLLIVPQTLQGVYRHRSCHVSARSPTAKS